MTYFLLILFFASFFGIIIMIGRKLVLIKNEQGLSQEEILLEIPYIRELRALTVVNMKKYGHVILIKTLRVYIRSTNFLKTRYEKIKITIKEKTENGFHEKTPEKIEVSKFLKMISDYKHKIRELKHKIREEEKKS